MPVNTPFEKTNSADLPSFLVGLRRFIDQNNPKPTGGHSNPAGEWRAQLSKIAPHHHPDIGLMLDFMGQLQADGLFDPLLSGAGNITNKSPNYRVEIEDLSLIDPHIKAVSVLRRNKGNPWFGFLLDDVETDMPRPWVFERRLRKGRTELNFDGSMTPPNIALFLWRWFGGARLTKPALFTDSPNLLDTAFDDLAAKFDTALIWPDQGALFAGENCFVTLSFGTLGWISEIMITDATTDHGLTADVCALLDLSPSVLQQVIDDSLKGGEARPST